jgi:hypothetical protein
MGEFDCKTQSLKLLCSLGNEDPDRLNYVPNLLEEEVELQ